ncbi:hypothetical protein [Paenibacillus thiaminolyticus]|uniref:Uncharacterized protein n=1 Tax=Paenibacillus thiaminolyticus TaxID=49283 RepID=A0A3A3GTN9_PANTH|nr:hypothetical protein [Paenibacillus thiaminolyticus]RJG20782.1 hypothetical protein DQX05_23960 [Paenibacillus thiaminolyticus]
MKIAITPPLSFLEGMEDLDSFEEVAEILFCFLERNDMLLFSYLESILRHVEPETKQFLEERTVFINSEWVLSHPPLNKIKPTLWVQPQNVAESVQLLKMNSLFTCIVLPKGAKFHDMSYVLDLFEGTEHEVLAIEQRTASNSDFETHVLPKLQNLLCTKLQIITPK